MAVFGTPRLNFPLKNESPVQFLHPPLGINHERSLSETLLDSVKIILFMSVFLDDPIRLLGSILTPTLVLGSILMSRRANSPQRMYFAVVVTLQ